MGRRDFSPIHPGEVLLHDFMEPMGITQYRVAREIGVPPRRINQIVHGERAISADTALRAAGRLTGERGPYPRNGSADPALLPR